MPPEAARPDDRSPIRKLRDCLQSVDFLRQLKLDELDKLMEALKKRQCPAGNTIIKQGDPGDAFYMISTGRVEVWDKGKLLTSRHPGEYFGESALVTEGPRAATVKAAVETELYVLYKEDFKKILMANPGIAASIKSHMAQLKYGSR
jgi:trk system potassium uptake protein TrkA